MISAKTFFDNSILRVTPYHKMILSNNHEIEAKNLKINDELLVDSRTNF